MNADDPRHGTLTGYKNHGCKCDRCRRANTEYQWRTMTGGYRRDACPHCGEPKQTVSRLCRSCYDATREVACGTESGYRDGCRCDLCRAAAALARRKRRQAKVPA